MSTVVGEHRRVYPGLDQFAVRGVVLLGAMTSVVAAQAAGARPEVWAQAVVTVLAVVLAVRPESAAGVLLLAGLAYVWSTVPDPLSPLVLLAAAGMVVVHVAALLAAQGPPRMCVNAGQALRWWWRGLLLWLAAVTVWGLGLLATDLPGGRLVYAAGLAVLVAIAATATWLLSPRR